MAMMTPRQAGGEVTRAKACFAFVRYGDSPEAGFYLPIHKSQAREILDHAKEREIAEVEVEVIRGKCFIGAAFDFTEGGDEEE